MNKIVAQLKKLNSYQPEKRSLLNAVKIYFLLFAVGSVIGWIYELFFYWIMEDRLTNNGFFFGPYLPIYGFGALFIIWLTRPLKKYPAAVFFLTIPITGILEYVTGYAMYELWQKRWWDYRTKFLNIDGYVCLRSVFTFALGAIALLYFVEPLVCLLFDKMKKKKQTFLCICILIVFIYDFILTMCIRVPRL